MILQLAFLRRIARRFLRRDVKYPASPQPLYEFEDSLFTQEDIAREYSEAVRERFGPLPIYEGRPYKFVTRVTEYVGIEPQQVKVLPGYFLTGHFTVVGADGIVQQVVISAPSGQQYDAAYFNNRIKSQMMGRFDSKQGLYDYLETAIIKSHWYLTTFVPKR